ncbi:matrix-remodeling-associated protein 5-like [Solea solea]|uniref:matrix-remodeling-associated protein 5-like n=1 Tax=Solea solea TaxID=90069 RepID=UPI00272C8D71|nr:matrix-remodeling-associated protein 5-like [Solea solea]
MYRTVCVALLLTTVVSSSQSCPRSCNCYQANEVHCTFRSLVTVPPGLPLHTRRINLGFNSISRIHGSSLTGLKRVELFMLHSNDLHHLPDAVFKDMKSLQILKLSYNKLREISSSLTFSGLTSLLRLYLDHNLLQFIHPRALLQLPSLRLLRLQGNRLHQLHPHTLCTLSLLNTYYFSTLRHLDLSNNSLTTLAKDTLVTAPLLETVVLQANPWSCDCRMNWLLPWSVAHPGLMKCPGDPQCPTCASPNSLQGQGLLDQIDLLCRSPVIPFPGRNNPSETELSEIQSSETFREPLGSAFLGLSDQQGNNVDLSCNITLSSDTQDIALAQDLSLSSSSPIPLALSLSLECPVETESYEILWRILAYYSETAVHLEREIMLSKDPEWAYRYKQAAETNGYYHTGVRASVKMKLQWLLQPAVSIQLNRAQSNGHKVHLIYSTRVSAHPDPTSSPLKPHLASQPWVLISTNHTITAMAAVSGSKVELSCPFLTSGNPKVKWILPDGSKLISPSSSLDGRLRASSTGLLLQKLQLSDAGLYYCVAQAGRDIDVLPLRLAVEESAVPPSGEQLGPPVTGNVGEPVSLSCKALGSPAPYLSWVFPDGTIVPSESALSSRFTIQPNGSLSLPDPSLRDAGYYRCIAVNHYGSDSLSMKLEIKPKHPPALRVPYPRGPQSAAGRSTKIRAPLLRQMLEGSGDEEEEEEKTFLDNRKHPRPHQRLPNRRYPMVKPGRRGPMREGPPRRGGGGSITSTDQRRNRFDTRHRVATNKQRIDPQKWAELLAKIRLKTAHTDNSQSTTAEEPTADPMGRDKDRDTSIDKAADNTEQGTSEEAGEDAEIEGSSVDDTVLQEEGLQPIHPVLTEMHTHSDTKTDTEIEGGRETSTEPQTNIEAKTHTQTQTSGPKTVTVTNPETHQELVSSQPISKSNEIVLKPVEGIDRIENPNPPLSRPQSPRQRLLPNMVPNSRPQRPWNTRRRIGQQRRIINRPRVQPLTPPRPLPDSSHHRSQTATPDTTIDQSNMLLAPTTIQSTRNDQIKTLPSGVNLLSPHISYSPVIATSESGSNSLTSSATPFTSLSPSHIKPHIDIMTHAADVQETAESTLVKPVTLAPTDSNIVISQTYVLDTHGIQTRRKPHIALEKHVLKASSKDNEEQERNLLGMTYKSHFTTLSSTYSIVATTASSPTTAKTSILPSTLFTSSATSTTPITTSEDTVPTTATLVTTNPIKLSTATAFIPPSSTTSSMTPAPTSTTTTTPVVTSTTSTTMMTSSTGPSTTSTTTTAATKTESSIQAILTTPNHSTTTAISTTPTTSTKMITSATPKAPTSISSTTITMTSASTRASFRERPSGGRVNTQGRPISGAQNHNRSPDWRKPGANFIPDSHRSRPHWSPSLPAVPGAPVLRSRPRIADPHIRTVSFPVESTARLTCEAQGEPKPSITWTKVATGAVMSIHSKAQRFEVLPNGTLVIQTVQLQDRGTYICSAQSFLGRDRLLTTLEVWTRPPRMQLASYRESTIHQGVELLLECQADGIPAPLLSWVLPDRSVLSSSDPPTGRIFMDTNGTLHILATLPSDRGVYRCVASNSAGAASSSVRVHVSSLPPVIQQPREEHLLLSPGRPVYAHCSARGAPPPYLRWRIPDGTLVRPSQFLHGNLFVLPNGTLHIRGVGPKDLGTYECTASNAVGADKRTVSVKMEGGAKAGRIEDTKPVATEKASSYSLSKDRSLSKPSHPTNPLNSPKLAPPLLTDRPRTLPITPNFSRSSFYPHQPSFPNSPPKINKTVANTVNNSKIGPNVVNNTQVLFPIPFDKSRTTAVLYPMPVSPFSKARIISTSPSITTVHHGGILQLHCSVTGNPTPIIIWRNPIRKLVDMNFSFDRRLKVHPNGTLSVQAVTERDAGDYLCIARNKVADDYRLLRVTVASKPAKIEPKQPLNQMVSFGKPLKMDCQASGLPDPAVHWSLPDGTMVNSVLQGEDRGGRARRLTVFDNGTLLVPAMGMREEGEYTCYAENQGGLDTMKVKVKVMMTSPPAYTEEKTYHIIKVRQGATATIHCPLMGALAPTVMWRSPANRIIPQSLGSGFYSERVVVVSDGTLEVRQAQKIDTGNYTCKASSSAGERSMVVSLEVEPFNHVISGHVGGRNAISINNAGVSQYGLTNGSSNKLGITNTNSNGHGNKNENSNTELNVGINMTTSRSIPSPTIDKRNGFHRPVSGITFDSSVSSAGVSGASNIGSKANNIGISRNGHGIVSSISNSVVNSHSTVPGTNYNEVITGRVTNDENTNSDNGRVSGTSRNVGVNSSITNSGAGTGILRRNWFSQTSHPSITDDDSKKSDIIAASNTGSKNIPSTVVGVVTTVKQQVVKGQTVLLPCPSQGSPPPRLAWLLPGNGVLPAPYYGSRLTVHRNGSLELRGVRATDAGTLVCVVRGEKGETRIQVELGISESQEETRSAHGALAVETPVQKGTGLSEARHSGATLDSTHSLSSVLHDKPRPRYPVTQKPPQKSLSSPAAPHPLGPPPHSPGPVLEPAASTRTASLVSIINGETLRLACPAPQTPGYTQGSLSWMTPSGNMLSRGDSGDSGRYVVQEDGTLTVQKATVFDRGTYTCTSTNYESSLVSVIKVPVIVIAYPPRITTGPSPITYTRPGVAVELPCLTIATPRATVTWETPDLTQLRVTVQARIYGNRYLSPQGSLVIQNPTNRDTGFYRCTAKNVIGVDTKTTYLHVM